MGPASDRVSVAECVSVAFATGAPSLPMPASLSKNWTSLSHPAGSPAAISSLGIVLQTASTGGWRYANRLIEGIRQVRPEMRITAYMRASLKSVCEKDSPSAGLQELGVEVKSLPYVRSLVHQSASKRWIGNLRRTFARKTFRRWQQELNSHSLVFFAWPFGIDCPAISTPISFIPHDFNYTHFTGGVALGPTYTQVQLKQHAEWLRRAQPIVSAQFMADELQQTFPEYHGRVPVIPLSCLGQDTRMSDSQADQIVRGLGVQRPYILSLNNNSPHKNLPQLLSGFHYVHQQVPELNLVLAGFGTENIAGHMHTPYYLDTCQPNGPVSSLGLRSDMEVEALIKGAALVINASVYEAGNGSGLDAWAMGTPVAMSSIPPFLEHEERLGVVAEKFHPRCCFEIGNAILRILQNPEQTRANVARSREAMASNTWEHVAQQYLAQFDAIAAKPLQ